MKKRKENNRPKRGFILAYVVSVATVIVLLIVGAVALVHSNVTMMKVSKTNFERDAALYQIEEYLAHGDYQIASEYALEHGFLVEVESSVEAGVSYFKITVTEQMAVRLYIEKQNGTIVKYIYGDK